MTVKINGTDITDYIAFGGFKWQREDIDGPDAGRTMDGTMQRMRVATKIRIDVTCRPLTSTELHTLQRLLYPQYITVSVSDDPLYGNKTMIMYSNNIPAQYIIKKRNGKEYWSTSFPLVER